MSLVRIRFGVRCAAAVIIVVTLSVGGYAVRVAHADVGSMIDRFTFVAVIAFGWILVEVVVGGFEQVARTTRERYEKLQAEAPDAYAIAGQAVCETLRVISEKAVEDSPNVSVLHR